MAIVDCNNFFMQKLWKLLLPSLENKHICGLSNNDGIARSDEAKALGMGAAAFMMEKCLSNKVAIFSSDYTLYGSLSDRVSRNFTIFCFKEVLKSIQ